MIIEVKVKPNSGKREVLKVNDSQYKIFLKKTPENGKANKELEMVLSKYFSMDAKILRGKTSKTKLVKIEDGN